jgi:hypothetical protein
MTLPNPQAAVDANLDQAIGFTIPSRSARGRIVRLGPLLDEILSAHDYPAADRPHPIRSNHSHRFARRDAQGRRADS